MSKQSNRSLVARLSNSLVRWVKEHPFQAFCYVVMSPLLLLAATVMSANILLEIQQVACPILPRVIGERLKCPTDQTPKPLPPAVLDPREELAVKMRIEWDEESFWKAVRRGDDRATQLFLRGGMTISSLGLHEVLADRQLTAKAPLHRLVEFADDKNSEFCSSDDESDPSKSPIPSHRTTRRFGHYATNDAAIGFVRSFCRGYDVISPLKRKLSFESEILKTTKAANERNTKGYSVCSNRYSKSEFWDNLQDLKRDCYNPKFSHPLDNELCWQIWELARQKFGDPSLKPGGLQLDLQLVPKFCRRKFAAPKETNDALVLELTAAVQKLID